MRIAVDDKGQSILVNKVALALMGDGLQLTQERLRATDEDAATRLVALIKNSIGPKWPNADQISQMVAVPRLSGKRALLIPACPLGPRAMRAFGRARAIVLIVDPKNRRRSKIDLLKRQFGLTSSEVRLTEALAAGHSLAEAANILGLTEETARYYLKSAFSKTETHRQGQLIALLSKVALLAGDSDPDSRR